MMKRLMIVDDEILIRQNIRNAIEWEKYGVEVCCEANNGKSALQQAMLYKPDIVLCDIRMPVMDGFEFLTILRASMPMVRFIMLTGYGCEEYTISALKAGANDFIQKPASVEKILEAVIEQCRLFDSAQEEAANQKKFATILDQNVHVLRSTLLKHMLYGEQRSQLVQGFHAFDFDIENRVFRLLLVYQPNGIYETVSRLYQMCADSFIDYINHEKLIVALLPPVPSENEDLSFLPDAHIVLPDFDPVDPDVEWLTYLLKRPHLLGCISPDKKEKDDYDKAAVSICESISGISRAIVSNRYEEASHFLAAFFSAVTEGRLTLDDTRAAYQGVALLILSETGKATEYSSFLEEWNNVWLLPEMQRMLTQLIPPSSQELHPHVKSAIDYITVHYAEPITLNSIARKLFISPNYLGRLFREQIGFSLNTYIKKFRIAKAEELLATTTMRHYEVAQKVGFPSYKVFAKEFMQVTGKTAKEYRITK